MIDHDPCDAAGSQDSVHFTDGLRRVRRMVQHAVGVHNVERTLGERKPLGVADGQVGLQTVERQPAFCDLDCLRGQIQTGQASGLRAALSYFSRVVEWDERVSGKRKCNH